MRIESQSVVAVTLTIDEIGGVLTSGLPAEGLDVPVTSESRVLVKVTVVSGMPSGGFVLARFFDTATGQPEIRTGTRLFLRPNTSNQFWGFVPLAKLSRQLGSEPNNVLYAGVHTTYDPESPMGVENVPVRAHLGTNCQTVIQVDARNALWFAFAVPDFPARSSAGSGENPEQEIADSVSFTGKSIYRPAMVLVPDGSTQVRISVASGNRWRHGDPANSNYESGPGGTNWSSGLFAGFASYYMDRGANKITDETLPHNLFVMMWDDGGNGPFTPIAAPLTTTDVDCTGKTKLFLAMHDSWQWNNNSGTQNVTLEWLFP